MGRQGHLDGKEAVSLDFPEVDEDGKNVCFI